MKCHHIFYSVTAACRENLLPPDGGICHMPKVTRNGGGLLSAPVLVLHYIGNHFPCTAWSSDLEMEAASGSSKTLVPMCQLTWHHILAQLSCTIHIKWSQRPYIIVIVYGKCNEIFNPPSYISQITHTFNCILHLYQLGGVFHFDDDTVQWGQYRQFSHTHCSIQQHYY